MYIAGDKSSTDWTNTRSKLIATNDPTVWAAAVKDYFHSRLALRYLDPIDCLQQNGTFSGEGFSIVTIQCSIIEFLESTIRGVSYRYPQRNQRLAQHEYGDSKNLFVDFLTTRQPFSGSFDRPLALDFYVGVRCGLMHEARTKNGWHIWAKSPTGAIIDGPLKRLFRDDFQSALLTFVAWYEAEVVKDVTLQQAFIRKFDYLASP